MTLQDSITLNVYGATQGQVTVLIANIQEVLIIEEKNNYSIKVVLSSGRAYRVVDSLGNHTYNTLTKALVAKQELLDNIDKALSTKLNIDTEDPEVRSDESVPSTKFFLDKLDSKIDKKAPINPGTKPKISYDENGLVVGGESLTKDDIPELPASKITSGVFSESQIPELPASKITSGVFREFQIPNIEIHKVVGLQEELLSLRESVEGGSDFDEEQLYIDLLSALGLTPIDPNAPDLPGEIIGGDWFTTLFDFLFNGGNWSTQSYDYIIKGGSW